MPPAPKTTFVSLFAAESEAALPSGDAAVSAALDAYGAVYSNGTGKKQKDLREETSPDFPGYTLTTRTLHLLSAALRSRISNSSLLLWALTTPLSRASRSGRPC